jgi:hypothetical protein
MARIALVASASAVAVLTVGAAPSYADSASLSITNTAGEPDAVAGLPRVFTLSGSTAAPERVYIKSRATGGAPCAPSAESDTGGVVATNEESNLAYGTAVNGAFSLKRVYTWEPPGAELFCVWIAETGSQIVTPISQVVTFRAPGGVISASINPATPRPNEQATVTVSGATEAPEEVFATVRPAGAPCAPTSVPTADRACSMAPRRTGCSACRGR